MNRPPRRAARGRRLALLGTLLVLGGLSPVLGNDTKRLVGGPAVPGPYEKSGVVTRYQPVPRSLPPDRDRDNWYNTRWDDHPDPNHPNSCKHGGFYGLRWKNTCTKCYAPYFWGRPGASTIDECCLPKPKTHRLWDNFLHPSRPVGHYYAGGCYVPVYDMDPLVTGPGPFPWPVFFKRPTGG